MAKRMIFDVESVGLAGEGFAVGWVVLDGAQEIDHGLHCSPSDHAAGTAMGRAWINANVPQRVRNPSPEDPIYCETPRIVRQRFWERWEGFGGREIELWGDCVWPVEARFLHAAVDDHRAVREMNGPFPLLDVATVFRAAREKNPFLLKDCVPADPHNPLEDARASSKTLLKLFELLGIRP